MPAKYAPDLMAELKRYIQQKEREIQQYAPNSPGYQNCQETIKEKERNLANIRGKYEKLSSIEKDKGRVNTALSLDIPVQKPYFQLLWWRHFNLTGEEVFGCWKPPLKQIHPDPRVTLIPEKGKQSLPPVQSQEQEYERYYVVLTSIHDNMLTGVQSISKTIWPAELADSVWFRFTCGRPYGPDKPFIEAALERVKADLALRKQNATPSIRRKKWTFVKTVPRWIYVLVLFLVALLGIFDYLGWLEPIRAFISNIVSPK